MVRETQDMDVTEIFHDSLERCGPASKFLGRFYVIFKASSKDVAQKFVGTDFTTQIRILKTSFYMAMLAADQPADTQCYLQRIAESHNRDHLDIKPEFYDLWLESLIQAVQEFDVDYDETVGSAWRQMMTPAIEYLKSKY